MREMRHAVVLKPEGRSNLEDLDIHEDNTEMHV
jgi:hypothetical protein